MTTAADDRGPAGDAGTASTAAPMTLVVLAAALALGGAIGAVSQFVLVKDLWVWEMPDLAHRFLAAAASAYVVGGAIVLAKRRAADAQLLAATVLVYGYPLVAAILVDPDVVDWGRPIAWTFILVVTPAVLVGTLGLLRARVRAAPAAKAPIARPVQALLAVLAVGAGLLGALVFLAPRDIGALWPWGALAPWKTLDHRLVASMLLTIAAGAGLALRRRDAHATALLLAMVIAYCAVAVAGLALHAADTPKLAGEDTVYIVVLTIAGLLAGTLLARGISARASAPAAPAPPPSRAAR